MNDEQEDKFYKAYEEWCEETKPEKFLVFEELVTIFGGKVICERDAYKAEALAARELLGKITGLEEMRLFGDRSVVVELYEAYLAARVKDGA